MLQETKLKPNEKIKWDSLSDFQVYYLSRQGSQCGGLALGVIKDLESTLIREGDDETEAISVQVVVGDISIRVITAYGAQENAVKERKEKVWLFIEQEVIQADLEGHGVIIQMDANLHAGPELLNSDPNLQNRNGKIFMDFLKRNPSLIVVNTLDICTGLITRKRELKTRTEEAVLDFFIVNENMRQFLKKMVIDEGREFCLSNFAQINKNKRVIETDHNGEILELNIEYGKKKPEREEMFNLRNKACQEAFKNETESNPKLIEVFENEMPIEKQSKMWFKNLKSSLYKSFRKVRIVNSKKKEKDDGNNLLKERIDLKKDLKSVNIDENMKEKIKERIKQIEEDVGVEVAEENVKEIVETLKKLGGDKHSLGGAGRKQMWRLLKNKYPKRLHVTPVGKKDKSGNLITNHDGLKQLYLQTYTQRLRNRPMKPEFEEIKMLKNKLFNMRS